MNNNQLNSNQNNNFGGNTSSFNQFSNSSNNMNNNQMNGNQNNNFGGNTSSFDQFSNNSNDMNNNQLNSNQNNNSNSNISLVNQATLNAYDSKNENQMPKGVKRKKAYWWTLLILVILPWLALISRFFIELSVDSESSPGGAIQGIIEVLRMLYFPGVLISFPSFIALVVIHFVGKSKNDVVTNNQSINNSNNNFNNEFSNNNFVEVSNRNITHNSMLRKAIKKEARSLPKKPMIITSAILLVSSFLLTLISAYFDAPLFDNVSTMAEFFIMFGIIYAALKISRREEVTLKEIFTIPFKKIKNILLFYLIVLGVFIIVAIVVGIIFFLVGLIGMLGNTSSTTAVAVISIILIIALVIAVTILSIYFAPLIYTTNVMIMDDNKKSLGIIEIIKESKKLVKGHRIQYYAMLFSFIGWVLLVPLTLGIISIWLIPYSQLSTVNLYRNWNKENGYVGSKKGLSDGAVVGLSALGYILIMVLLVAITTIVGLGATKNVRSSYGGSIKNIKGVNIYVPSDFNQKEYIDGEIMYYSEDGNEALGVFKIDVPNSNGIEDMVDAYADKYYQKNKESCYSPYKVSIGNREWTEISCDISGIDLQNYITFENDAIYGVRIATNDYAKMYKIKNSIEIE